VYFEKKALMTVDPVSHYKSVIRSTDKYYHLTII